MLALIGEIEKMENGVGLAETIAQLVVLSAGQCSAELLRLRTQDYVLSFIELLVGDVDAYVDARKSQRRQGETLQ